ncbi:uncharacterized protein BDZ99DRAFT_522809 [Mytilinidion resinicola]|uniref:Uncharacterized protein n=1 Tax=Mytilinidion resinicola TaxID=574789 RepID=A0A6A6YED8_9PEZI|nr:uncharacterized protein BDZ99DRAFT_522809 [Mytilinidion resinicola]KAF2807186.1 hypothetical protein BDZ99DRAFT_522809 [Mytilinidion resinicola]
MPHEITTSAGESDKGSSFATAYAVGLAALILQCLKAHHELENYYNDMDENEPNLALKYKDKHVVTRLKEATPIDGMRKILKALSTMHANDPIPDKRLFVRPYKVLINDFGTDDSTKMSSLRNIGPKVLP